MDEKQPQTISKIWNIKKDQIALMVNSYNSNSCGNKLVSPLEYNPKTNTVYRVTLCIKPQSNGKISMKFSTVGDKCKFRIQCNKPYLNSMNNTFFVDKSALLSAGNISVQYTITPQTSRVFSMSQNDGNFNKSNFVTIASKPISFECRFNSSILKEIKEKTTNNNNNNKGVYSIKSVCDPITNTMWDLYLVLYTSNGGYKIKIQPAQSKSAVIKAWIDIECSDILFYTSATSTFGRFSDNHTFKNFISTKQFEFGDASAKLLQQKVIKLKFNILGLKWFNNWERDITSDLCLVGSLLANNNSNNNDIFIKKMNEMSLQMQTLSTGSNHLIKKTKLNNNAIDIKIDKLNNKLNDQKKDINNTINNALYGISKDIKKYTVNNKLDAMNNGLTIDTLNDKLDTITKTLNNSISNDTRIDAVNNKINSMTKILKKDTKNNDTKINALNVKLDAMAKILDKISNDILNQSNDDNKSNDNNNLMNTFDPVYAEFYYWLTKTVCLPKYLDKLKTSGFDAMDAVVELNDKDLIDIGVGAKGHRVRLLKAIKKYKQKKKCK